MAAGRLHPLVGMAFVWATIRPQDMVCVGTLNADEAKELIDISLQVLENRQAAAELQATRSKASNVSTQHEAQDASHTTRGESHTT